MFVGVLNLMHVKAIQKFQNEMVHNSTICFYCEMIENNHKGLNDSLHENKQEESQVEMTPCHKCKRAYFHDYDCLKKMKSRHDSICLKYADNWEHVNRIVENTY